MKRFITQFYGRVISDHDTLHEACLAGANYSREKHVSPVDVVDSENPAYPTQVHIGAEADRMRTASLETEIARLRKLLSAGPGQVLRCAFCGDPYPEGTPDHKSDALAAHIRICEAHPIGRENRELRAKLDAAEVEIARLIPGPEIVRIEK